MQSKYNRYYYLSLVYALLFSFLSVSAQEGYVANAITESACVYQFGETINYGAIMGAGGFHSSSDYNNITFYWSASGGEIVGDNNLSNVSVKWLSKPQTLSVLVKFQDCDGGHCAPFDIFNSSLSPSYFPDLFPNIITSSSSAIAYSYLLTPAPLTDVVPPPVVNACGDPTYEWEYSDVPLGPFHPLSVYTREYVFSSPLNHTTYYQRKLTTTSGVTTYSNIIKIDVVSINWENQNYVREHNILVPGITDWKQVDQLPIGQKLQTTTYLDGLGRAIQSISRETATPEDPNAPTTTLWGDVVQFSVYDEFGRQSQQYIPYTTTTESKFFKTDPLDEHPTYGGTHYGVFYSYSTTEYDDDPLDRVKKIWKPGNTRGTVQANYDLNAENEVRILTIGPGSNAIPVNVVLNTSSQGFYPAFTLVKNISIEKNISTDEKGKTVIEYINNSGQTILKKVQLAENPDATSNTGWICTYNIYDDYGRLRYILTPKAVEWFDQLSARWQFNSDAETVQVLNGLCFHYEYDEKGRTILKKSPDASELHMIYDKRDRLVYTQDGNQRTKANGEWTAGLYDELDRPVITALYQPTIALAWPQELNASGNNGTVNTIHPGKALTSDLVVNHRNLSDGDYKARNSIAFVDDEGGSFESPSGDEFGADVDPAATAPAISSSVTVYNSPLSESDLNSATCTILKYLFYDDYSQTGSRQPFSTVYQNSSANDINIANDYIDPNISPGLLLPITKTARTSGLTTGTRKRVLGTDSFLDGTYYYDEQGNLIQTIEDNILEGKDINTSQYRWDGRLLSTYTEHTTLNTGYSQFGILTKNVYDKIGRLSRIFKRVGNDNEWKEIASYQWDDMGRLKNKTLAPGYQNATTGKPYMESLDYGYNVHGQLISVNKDYALKTESIYNKWGNYFGLYLGYDDNPDNLFTQPLHTGQLAGQVWNSQGDDAQRKYDYNYDNAGRFLKASFTEKAITTDDWINTKMDFSVGGIGGVTGTDGNITYDLNGNLLNMVQKGVTIGNPNPVTIDNLRYTYYANSNQLKNVVDLSNNQTAGLGDFKMGGDDGHYGNFKQQYVDQYNADPAHVTVSLDNSFDYIYDSDGNLVKDMNKGIYGESVGGGFHGPAITYNYLDKPEKILIQNKGTVKIVYDADGNKLQRIFTPMYGGIAKTTTYINQFTYEGTTATTTNGQLIPLELKSIAFEEGRIRVIKEVYQYALDEASQTAEILHIQGSNIYLPNGMHGVYDFYVTDQQTNVRMILTEEKHISMAACTMENAVAGRAALEEGMFGQVNSDGSIPVSNEVLASRYPTANIPGQSSGGGWQSNSSEQVSRLGNWAGHTVGPNQLLKVMAGDKITAFSQYYYKAPLDNGSQSNDNFLTSVLAALSGVVSNSSLPAHGAASSITSQLEVSGAFTSLVSPADEPDTPVKPKAGLTVVFFDERFNYVEEGSFFVRVTTAGDGAPLLIDFDNIETKAPKNGYCYIYLSNQSNEDVFFDNFQVRHDRGRIIEENHYYAYGLKIASISSRKLADPAEGKIENNYGYQGEYSEFDDDLGWNDFDLRSYDPQIGRWLQVDPYDQFASGYVGMGGNPINNIDKDGGISLGLFGAAIGAIAGGITGALIAKNNGVSVGGTIFAGVTGALIGAGIGYGIAESISNFKNSNFRGSETSYGTQGSYSNPSTNFLDNTISFYKGLFGDPGATTKLFTNSDYFAYAPNITGAWTIGLKKFRFPAPLGFFLSGTGAFLVPLGPVGQILSIVIAFYFTGVNITEEITLPYFKKRLP